MAQTVFTAAAARTGQKVAFRALRVKYFKEAIRRRHRAGFAILAVIPAKFRAPLRVAVPLRVATSEGATEKVAIFFTGRR